MQLSENGFDAHGGRITQAQVMHTRDGDEYYIVPGGRVDARDALKILERPDVRSFDDGLFPGHSQQWRICR
jgi:hypothetical protein